MPRQPSTPSNKKAAGPKTLDSTKKSELAVTLPQENGSPQINGNSPHIAETNGINGHLEPNVAVSQPEA